MDGSQIAGYKIIDDSGNETLVKKDTIEELANDGLIVNCTIVDYNGKKYLKGLGISIGELPVIDLKHKDSSSIIESGVKLTLKKRRVNKANKLVGYIAEGSNNKEYSLSVDETWNLCRDGVITNAKAQISDKAKLLIGLGIELRTLEKVVQD